MTSSVCPGSKPPFPAFPIQLHRSAWMLPSCTQLVCSHCKRGICCCQSQVPAPPVHWSAVDDRPLICFLCAAYLDSPDLGYTVFAPTNAAFQRTFNSLNTNLTDILYMGHLDALIQYHFLLQPYMVRPVQCSPSEVQTMVQAVRDMRLAESGEDR